MTFEMLSSHISAISRAFFSPQPPFQALWITNVHDYLFRQGIHLDTPMRLPPPDGSDRALFTETLKQFYDGKPDARAVEILGVE